MQQSQHRHTAGWAGCNQGKVRKAISSCAEAWGWHLLIYERSDWEAVEALCEGLPQAHVVPPFALIVEAVDAVDAGALVVAPEQKEVLWELDLQPHLLVSFAAESRHQCLPCAIQAMTVEICVHSRCWSAQGHAGLAGKLIVCKLLKLRPLRVRALVRA